MTLSELFEKEIGKIGVCTSSSTSKKKTFEKQSGDSISPSIPFKRRRQYVNMLTDISSMIRAVDTRLSANNTNNTNNTTTSPSVEKNTILQQYIDKQWEKRRHRIAEQHAYQQQVCGTDSLPVCYHFLFITF